eukprot:928479-Rhodomonas_salina.1
MDRQRAEAKAMRVKLQHKHDTQLANKGGWRAGAPSNSAVEGQVVFGHHFGAPAAASAPAASKPTIQIPRAPSEPRSGSPTAGSPTAGTP